MPDNLAVTVVRDQMLRSVLMLSQLQGKLYAIQINPHASAITAAIDGGSQRSDSLFARTAVDYFWRSCSHTEPDSTVTRTLCIELLTTDVVWMKQTLPLECLE